MTKASHNFNGKVESESRSNRPALVAIDLGADSCRISLLRWIEIQPEVQLVHRFANSPVKEQDTLRWAPSRRRAVAQFRK
jgi:hypothetical protein